MQKENKRERIEIINKKMILETDDSLINHYSPDKPNQTHQLINQMISTPLSTINVLPFLFNEYKHSPFTLFDSAYISMNKNESAKETSYSPHGIMHLNSSFSLSNSSLHANDINSDSSPVSRNYQTNRKLIGFKPYELV
jgi:hypothetical protein